MLGPALPSLHSANKTSYVPSWSPLCQWGHNTWHLSLDHQLKGSTCEYNEVTCEPSSHYPPPEDQGIVAKTVCNN